MADVYELVVVSEVGLNPGVCVVPVMLRVDEVGEEDGAADGISCSREVQRDGNIEMAGICQVLCLVLIIDCTASNRLLELRWAFSWAMAQTRILERNGKLKIRQKL